MNARMRPLLLTIVLLFVLSVAATPASANHSWGGYHWARTNNPFTVKLGDNLTSNWKPYLSTTSSDWSKSTVLDTTIVAGLAGNKRCRPTTGRVEVCNAAYGQNGWLGLAQVWVSGSHITQGTTKMNDTYFAMSRYNTVAERNHVMCQEVGHTFGLGHQDESGAALGTCMDYSMDAGSQHPNQHDYDMLVQIYSHLDSTTTVFSSTPQDIAQGNFESRAQWGRLISQTKRASIYKREFKGGHKVFTFVYWADPNQEHTD
jgi:hypothetical protein